MAVELSYCVVNTEGRELLLRCLDAIALEQAQLDVPSEVLVLDNASGDGSAAAARRHPVPTEVLALERRHGKGENDFLARIDAAARQAQADGDIASSDDVEQLVFELHAFMLLANALFVLTQDSAPMERARRAIDRRLAVAPTPARP